MPELPEVEIAGRQLHRWLSGRPVDRVVVLDPAVVRSELSTRPSMAVEDGAAVLEALLQGVPERPLRHGKRLGWPWGERGLLIHLGMSGKFVRLPVGEQPPASARVGWVQGEWTVWFVDRRRFGCLVGVEGSAMGAALRAGHGPDALDEALDGPGLAARLTGRRAIKVALLDQARLAGVGNIHAVEALFRAGVDPRLRCDALTERQWARLAEAIPAQLQWVVDAEDRGEIEYITEGGTENPFSVYGREGEECPVCGGLIERIKQSGRGTWFCPSCQG